MVVIPASKLMFICNSIDYKLNLLYGCGDWVGCTTDAEGWRAVVDCWKWVISVAVVVLGTINKEVLGINGDVDDVGEETTDKNSMPLLYMWYCYKKFSKYIYINTCTHVYMHFRQCMHFG